ncbi:hypothetical protein phiA034_gene0028 [Aeromonas phage phiA034]|uniref:BRCT domain-containing protein n=1 Tax=Aeromonas phage phiA034 TaxID=2985287 RepID=A0AAE9YG65_9CAUD|nr:hypothetical protein phiA034_gene0028 [Aeromonas phage phiA034]
MSEQNKKYRRKLIGWVPGTDKPLAVETDVYRVLDAFKVSDPCLQHLVKKALAAGDRGHKDLAQDYQDIVHSANSALDLLNGKNATTEGSRLEQDAISLAERRQSPLSKFSFHMVLSDQEADAKSTLAKFLSGSKRLHGRVGEKSFAITTPTGRFRWPDWLEQAMTNMDWVNIAHDEWAATGHHPQNMPRAAAYDFGELERAAVATLGKAFSDYVAELSEACASNEEPAPKEKRHPGVGMYALCAPYGPVGDNQVRLLQHECPHCRCVILSCEVPRHKDNLRGYPGASCPHCKGDLAGADFVNWADVDAIFDNLVKVPPEHLRSFFKSVRLHRAGYGTNTSMRAALHNYYVQVLGGDAKDADKFARKVWPELPEIHATRKQAQEALAKKRRRRVERLTKILAGHGVAKDAEVVISGGCEFKDLVVEAVEGLGGTVRASVTQKTKIIIAGDKPGAKLAKAIELGVTIVFASNLRLTLYKPDSEE